MRAAVLAVAAASLLPALSAQADARAAAGALGDGDHAFTVERLDAPLAPGDATPGPGRDAQGRPLTDIDGVALRWWLRRGRADFGLGVGALGYRGAAAGGDGAPQALEHGASTIVVGWRWSMGARSTLYADAMGSRGLGLGAELYQTKVGVEWKTRSAPLGFERGALLGVRFDSGYRMTLRPRRGGLGIYLRGHF